MTTLLFVHGTGVRLEGHTRTLVRIRASVAEKAPTMRVEGVPWGDRLPVFVDGHSLESVLPIASNKAVGIDEATIEAQLWADLLDDPLLELRAPGPDERTAADIAVGPEAAGRSLKHRLSQLQVDPDLVVAGVTGKQIAEAALWLADETEAEQIQWATVDDLDVLDCVARAVVARVLATISADLGEGPDALYLSQARRSLHEFVLEAIGARVKSGGSFSQALVRMAAARATQAAATRRLRLMGRATPGVGDILSYQRRGDAVRDLVDAAARRLDGDVYLLGHSLGGIIAMDVLTAPNPPANVKGLITVGSQVAYFWLADALQHLRRVGGPPPFKPWLNIYDPNDFLSFRAGEVFEGPGIEDIPVTSGAPFPQSHGAYWRMPAVYSAMATFCERGAP